MVGKNEKDLAQLNVSLSNQSPSVSQNNMHLIAMNSAATTQNSNGSNNANTSHMNKLKLLKKRNALKKSVSNATNNNNNSMNERTTSLVAGGGPANNSYQLNTSKDELQKSQTSFTNLINPNNNLSNKKLSKHLSKYYFVIIVVIQPYLVNPY